jgi:O-methyltransferase
MFLIKFKVWLKKLLGFGSYEKLKIFLGSSHSCIRKFISSLFGFPQINCFPSDCIHTNSIWTIGNWKYLNRGYKDELLIKNCIVKVRNYTMVTHDGLLSTFDICSHIVRANIKGAFVEMGCCKGGAAAMMAFAVANQKQTREIHLFDSFKGLPNPTSKEYEPWMKAAWNISKGDADGALIGSGALLAERVEAENVLFKIAGYPADKVFFHVGWFQDTLPEVKESIGNIALLRLDGDLYDSTIVSLRNLYPQVVSGGFIIIDDYGLKGCRDACKDYFNEINIKPYLSYIDEIGRYFIKN